MITKYLCEFCKQEFGDMNQCWDHEDAHVKPTAREVKPVSYVPPEDSLCPSDCDPRPYPLDIKVPMSDGAEVQYTFERIISSPLAANIAPEVTEQGMVTI